MYIFELEGVYNWQKDSLQCRRFRFGARDRKFAAILANCHSLGRIFVSPQASSEFESKMALA